MYLEVSDVVHSHAQLGHGGQACAGSWSKAVEPFSVTYTWNVLIYGTCYCGAVDDDQHERV